ncbi:unnamed protein product [Phytophthora lilii]|uniref:Unnamed protein product n=1 Tax=Phytophthora lilii TaxID=2077276 RepID=A0A9W6YHV4_9STRA|nr:unnamed protein product [Phytophthora lilii]
MSASRLSEQLTRGSARLHCTHLVRRDEISLVAEERPDDEQHAHDHEPQHNEQRVGLEPVVDIVSLGESLRCHVDHHRALENLQHQIEHEQPPVALANTRPNAVTTASTTEPGSFTRLVVTTDATSL